MIHAETIVQTIRFYDEGVSYGGPYKAIATVQRTGYIATISGLHGEIGYNDYADLISYLGESGIREVHWLRGDGSRRIKHLGDKEELAEIAA